MRCEVVPSKLSNLVPFSSSSYSSYYTENVENSFGFISKNGLWLYLVHDTVIDIYSTESGKWCGGHCFEESLKNPSAKVTAAVEFTSSHISFPCLLLAVNQDEESLLCMFDVNSCKVVRAILVPDRITSLDVVSGNGGVCIETHYLSRRLRFMFGIIAVGTLHGHVFFLDLCLDENFNCSEKLPNITAVVKQQDFTAEKREAVIAKKQHVLLHLNVESSPMVGGTFEFKSRSSTLGRFPNADIYVTALKYIPSLTTLAVGFNFGGIQLWELHHLSLQFTIPYDHEQAIVNFAFQEPENDPRNFCYLWVIQGHSMTRKSAVSVAALYSLNYFKRDFVQGFGALYIELRNCSKRFELNLTGDVFNSGCLGSRLLSCQIVSQRDVHHTLDAISTNESDSVSEDTSLCFLAWEAWPVWPDSEHLPFSYHLAVFDLNQWYQAHMPSTFRCHPNELSPYLGFFSLKEAARKFDEGIMGLYTIPHSIKKFKSLSVSEEFFYPTSVSFQQMCFSESGLCKSTYFGLQRHLLFEVAEMGPQVLLNPKDIYPFLIKSGVVADSHGGSERTPLKIQKENLLQLALEYHLPFFFMKCLKEWRYTESIHECCTSKALLSWAWKKVKNIKNSIDRFTLPLFNCSGEDVDKASLKQLYSFRRQLSLIDSIMAGYEKYVTPRTELGIQELQCRRGAISSINMYLQVLLWLRSVHVLPEFCEEEAPVKSVAYRLSYFCHSGLQKLYSSLAVLDVLLVEGMVKEVGIGSSWQEKGGNGNYPPPSIYAALSCYLLEGVSMESKHALVYYLLLDLQDMNPDASFPSELKKFPVIFGLSKSKVKLIKAFWYLDRQDTELAIRKLLHPAVRVCDILPWQHQRILKSFLFWRAPQKALKYIDHTEPPQTTVEDMKLHLSILLACGAITQAYEYQRKKQHQGYGNELLNHLFLGCRDMHIMKDLMYLPLNSLESCALVKFLSESEDPHSQELLVIYHLLHCNFFEAAKVNEKLSRLLMNKIASIYDTNIRERTMDREALVESLMAAVSSTERSLVEEMERLPSETSKKEEVYDFTSEPLSFSVKCNGVKPMSYSDMLVSLLSLPSPSTGPSTCQESRSSRFEDMPFLRPPVTPEYKSQRPANSGNAVVTKRSLIISPTEYSSPAKRSRLLDNVPFKSSPLLRRTPKHLAGDIVSLLQTPPIHRRTSTGLRSKDLKNTPTVAPQSILKKKQETKKKGQLDFHTAPTPPLCSEDESSEDDVMQMGEKNLEVKETANSENTSRQIRFDLPVKDQDGNKSSYLEPPAQDISVVPQDVSEMHSIGADGCLNIDTSVRVVRKTFGNLTREPIRDDSCLSITTPTEVAGKTLGSLTREPIRDDSCLSITTPTEVAGKTLGSLTREPLRSLKKRISFHDDIPPTAKADVQMEVEILDVSEEEEEKEASPVKSSPMEQPEIISISDQEDDDGTFATTVTYDSGIATSTKSIAFLQENISTDSSAFKSSKLVDDDVEIVLEVPSHNQSFQRSYVTPRLPLRSDFPLSIEHEEIFLDGFESGLQKNTSSAVEKDISLAYSADPEDCVIEEQILTEEEQSENETFYSPCSEQSNFVRASFTFAEPVTLFPDLPDGESDINIDNIVTDIMSKESPNESNKLISFAFSEPSDISKAETKSDYLLEASSQSSDGLKCEFRNFVFDEHLPSEKTVHFKADTEEKTLSKQDATEDQCEEHAPKTSNVVPKRRFTFTRRTSSEAIEELTVKDAKPTDEADKTKSKLDIAESSKTEAMCQSQTVKTASVSRRFTFTKLSKITELEVKEVEESRDSTNKQDSKMDVTADSLCKIVSEPLASKVSDIVPKYQFIFTKTADDPEVKKTEGQKITSDENNSKMDITESRLQVEPELPSTDDNTKPSRRKFVFTRHIPSTKSSSTEEKSSLKEEVKQASLDQSNNKTEFLQADTAGTYEEFSSSLAKNTSVEGTSPDEDKKNLLSSPCMTTDSKSHSSSIQETPSAATVKSIKKTVKKHSSSKPRVDKSVGTTPSFSKKKKSKGKASQKKEFFFAEPTSPATPEILEQLAKSPEAPLPSFMFSPPLTRGRLRKKRLDETMGSSFCSTVSDASFLSRPPPMDSILEDIILDKKMEPRRTTRTSAQKRSTIKKPKMPGRLDMSDKSLLVASFLDESKVSSPSKRSSPSSKNSSIRHSMVLRQAKPKPDSLF